MNDDDEIAEGEIVTEPGPQDHIGDQSTATTASMALIPVEPGGLARPVAGVDEVREAFEQYLTLRRTIVVESDITRIGKKEFVNKSGWRKLGTVMGTSSELRSRDYARDAQGRTVSAEVVVRAHAPNGRFMDGLGVCEIHERCCPRAYEGGVCTDKRSYHTHCEPGCDGFLHFSKPQHDLPATAYTRALNRASSDLFGFGEVSAEEITDRDEPAPEEWRRRVAAAMNAIEDEEQKRMVKCKFVDGFGMPGELRKGQMVAVETSLKNAGLTIPDTIPDPAAGGQPDAAPPASSPSSHSREGGPTDNGESNGSARAGGGRTGTVVAPPAATPPAEPAKPATPQQKRNLGIRIAELEANEFIPKGAKDELVASLTGGRTTSRTQLSTEEAGKLLALCHQLQNGNVSYNPPGSNPGQGGDLPLLTGNNPPGDKFLESWPQLQEQT